MIFCFHKTTHLLLLCTFKDSANRISVNRDWTATSHSIPCLQYVLRYVQTINVELQREDRYGIVAQDSEIVGYIQPWLCRCVRCIRCIQCGVSSHRSICEAVTTPRKFISLPDDLFCTMSRPFMGHSKFSFPHEACARDSLYATNGHITGYA